VVTSTEGQIKSFKDLVVWQEAVELATLTYRLTSSFPKRETYGMMSQMQRAAVSIAANIAEGHGREQTGVFIQFLRAEQGSLKELETHFIIAEKVELISKDQSSPLMEKCEAIGKMLRSLIRSLENWQSRNT
jgi:four helix bundle protein